MLWGLILVLYCFVLLFTSSRGGWLGTFAAFFVLLCMLLAEKFWGSVTKLSGAERRRIIIVAIVGILFFAALLILVFFRSQFTGTRQRTTLPLCDDRTPISVVDPDQRII